MSTEETKPLKPLIEDRIYVGNVDFKATEDELKELFKDLKVSDVEIPFKESVKNGKTFKKHLGFAFVQFESKDDADKAIDQFNGQKFQRRNIFIRKAVPPPTEEEKKERVAIYRAKKEEEKKEKEEQKALAKKRREEATASSSANNGESGTATIPDGTPSTDTIFITNLDYKVNVKTLKLKPKWIHVPARKVPYNRRGRGGKFRRPFNKGIAFVKFANEETQKQAVAEFNGKEINGREIIVDIAIDSRVPKEGTGEDVDGEEEEEQVKAEDVATEEEKPEQKEE
ncbi:tcg1 Single-stranded TG1-3 DNA-binding protein [Candida maltosa Xu316]